MTRLKIRIAQTLASSCAAFALLTATTMAHAAQLEHASAVVAAPAAIVTDGRFCYNWDFFNYTPQDANDLHFRIRGVSQVNVWYTGGANTFGQPDASSGYDAATDSYAVNLSNGIVPTGEKLHIGLCTDHPALEVVDATWTVNGAPIGPAPMYANLQITKVGPNQFRVQLTNPQPFNTTLLAFNVLDPMDALPLDDLNGEVAAQMSLVGEGVLVPEVLPPNGTRSFDVFLGGAQSGMHAASAGEGTMLDADHPLVVEAILAAEDDPGNVVHLVAQMLPPSKQFLPVVTKQ